MTSTWRHGHVAGVEIGVKWSWLVVVGLVTWSLAAGVFPETNPGLDDATYVAMAAVAVPVFFACLLLHELGHAVVARREGMVIDGITLWVFGGVARFKGRFPSACAEFRIAIAGPAVSLVLGLVFIATAGLLALPAAVDGVVHWLGVINLTLLAFNLLPALPLDGGRVLRAALWQRRGDLDGATRAAAALGRAFGQALIVVGFALVLLAGGIGGLWFALIGWFVLGAASAEEAAVRQEHALAGRTVADAMVRDPVTVGADLPLTAFLDVVLAHRHTAYPVPEGARVAGLVSFRALARGAGPDAAVRDVMVPLGEVLVVRPDAALADVLPELLGPPLRRALVTDGDGYGLLSITDATRPARGARRRGPEVKPARAVIYGLRSARSDGWRGRAPAVA
jgi:Zn-dependent protease/CBS domain-containing protein